MQTMVPLYGFGGVPYSAVRKAAPRNLLDNSDFRDPVNQRGQASYTGEYGIDRWRVWNSDTLTVNSGYITVNGSVFQYLMPSVAQNSVHTLAAKKTDGSILLYTKNPFEAYSTADNGLGLGLDNNVVIHLPTGSYLWAALYEGEYTAETLPEYQPKGYGAELAECQRYYQRFHYSQYETIAMGFEASGYAFIQLSANNMRLKFPTMTISAPIQIGSRTYMPTGCNINNGTIIIGLNYDTTTTNVGACYAYCPSAGGCVIELNEDL